METSSTNSISLDSFQRDFHELLLSFLWREWSALGIAGYSDQTKRQPSIIDPEALLLLSTVIARLDARLFDEILDWLSVNESWINVQRLARMQHETKLGNGDVLGAMAEHLPRDSALSKWALVNLLGDAPIPREPRQPLFPGVPLFGTLDDNFLKWGLERGPVQLRGLSQPPRPDRPATFLFKLRALFGRQSRAEVIAWLLTHDSGHPAEIARQIGYFPRSIQLVLNELEMSGHVRGFRQGREKKFAIYPPDWTFLLTWPTITGTEFPRWENWPDLFVTLSSIYDMLTRFGVRAMSPQVVAVEFRKAINAISISRTGLPAPFVPRPITGEQFLEEAWLELKSLLE